MPPARLLRLVIAVIVLISALGVACDDAAAPPLRPTPSTDRDTTPRSFAMGLSSLPSELTRDSYTEAFDLAAATGEVILIQRTPPWSELISGGSISQDTASTTEREVDLARDRGLDIFVAIDPIGVVNGQTEIADLPADLRGAGFGDEQIQRAFIAYAEYVARNYQPKYLALGVEVNSYQQQHPEDFERFVVLYHETYLAVKEILPETLVFPTFQLEELQGLLPAGDPLPPQWYLISRFEPRLDLLAVSSYPALVFPALALVPEAYYVGLRAYSSRPVAFTSIGFPSAPDTVSTEDDQAEFLRHILDNAQQLASPLFVWFAGQDPTFTGDPSRGWLEHIGLRRQDGAEKEAWSVWEETSRRVVEEPTTAPTPTVAPGTTPTP